MQARESHPCHEEPRSSHATVLAGLMMAAAIVVAPGCGALADLYGMDPPDGSDAPGAVTVFFDGAEGTAPGTTSFSFMGASFAGGRVTTLGRPDLYGSGSYAYEVTADNPVTVTFDAPVDVLELVLVTRGTGTTTATAFDEQDQVVGTLIGDDNARRAVQLSANATRVEVVHTGGADSDGWIDNFSFRIAD